MDLNQVTLASTDLSVSIPFYQSLGLRLIVDSSSRYARFECPQGHTTFSLHHKEEHRGNPGTMIYFECRDLDQVVVRLKRKGVIFDQDPVNQSWLWREARLRDPDDNYLCLFWGGENRKSPPWRVK